MVSIIPRSKTIEDTEKAIQRFLPTKDEDVKTYRVIYAVHECLPSPSETRFIGLVTLKSLDVGIHLVLPESLTLPESAAATTLTVELAYGLLPSAWGNSYATEALNAVFEACKRARDFWEPFQKVYVRVIVNGGNPSSLRVMEKIGVERKGIFKWTGRIWLAGGWREEDDLHIFGFYLLE